MGYQALLFCPDEKLARVVTQVFTELDFTVESVNEPFAAVKKLMAHRYDAVVVDCENEQNATLLFKSARNSGSNQSSLALALVEGQAGVAKAYRIGANLVLTKPINVEQAKGTLRVARGLLRKNADAAASSTTASNAARPAATPKTTAAPAFSASTTPSVRPEPVAKPGNALGSPEFESAMPAMAASAEVQESPAPGPSPWTKIPLDAEPSVTLHHQHQNAAPEPPKPVAAAPVLPAPVKKPVASMGISQGAAAAPAPAREAPAHSEKKKAESEVFEAREASIPTFRSAETIAAPTFGAFSDSDDADGSGSGSKKILVGAAVLIVVAGLGYAGWAKFGKASTASTQPAPNPVSVQAPAPSSPIVPNGTSEAAAPAAQPAPTPASPTAQSAKPSANLSNPAANRIIASTDPVPSKPEPTPIRVKTQPATTSHPKPATEEAAPQVPNPLVVASGNDKGLSGLVASTPVNIPRQAPTSMLKISQGVSQGLLINRVQPKYPQNALAMRIQGAVQIEATINKEGKTTNLKTLSGDPVLARAALDAVRQWRYKPYFLDGEPVDIQTQITVNFKLPN